MYCKRLLLPIEIGIAVTNTKNTFFERTQRLKDWKITIALGQELKNLKIA